MSQRAKELVGKERALASLTGLNIAERASLFADPRSFLRRIFVTSSESSHASTSILPRAID